MRSRAAQTALGAAVERGDLEAVDLLLARRPPLRYALWKAVERGDAGLLRRLLEHGGAPPDPDAPAEPLPLHRALERGDEELAGLLIDHGIDLRVSSRGRSALDLALEKGFTPSQRGCAAGRERARAPPLPVDGVAGAARRPPPAVAGVGRAGGGVRVPRGLGPRRRPRAAPPRRVARAEDRTSRGRQPPCVARCGAGRARRERHRECRRAGTSKRQEHGRLLPNGNEAAAGRVVGVRPRTERCDVGGRQDPPGRGPPRQVRRDGPLDGFVRFRLRCALDDVDWFGAYVRGEGLDAYGLARVQLPGRFPPCLADPTTAPRARPTTDVSGRR